MRNVLWFIFATSLFIAFTQARADTDKAMTLLRSTSLRIEGNNCIGSGSIVQGPSGKRYILTNNHVCNCAKWKGGLYGSFDSGQMLLGKVVKQDWSADLCAAEIKEPLPSLKLGRRLLPLTEVNTRGYPGGRLAESHGRVREYWGWDYTMGIEKLGVCPPVSKKEYGYNGLLEACTFHFVSILTDLYGRPGSSGSPVVNDDGELVGVVSSWNPYSAYEAGIVPFPQVQSFLGSL